MAYKMRKTTIGKGRTFRVENLFVLGLKVGLVREVRQLEEDGNVKIIE